MAKTRFFRVAVEGATATDGRTITREMIDQAAAAYNTATYTARINCEHIRGFSPEPPFNAYGSVAAVKAEDHEIQIDGQNETRRALYAQLDANDQMVATIKADQKIFTSCEFQPNFAKTGKFGLVGLAITDNPASLGTEALSFSAFKPMWDARKSDPSNLFSAAEENSFALEAGETGPGVADAIVAGFAKVAAMFGRQVEQPKPETKPEQKPANDNIDMAAFSTAIGEAVAAAVKPAHDAIAATQAELSSLKTQLEGTPAGFSRPPATGGTGKHLTDC
jgi:Phage capsid scaffolding protein (GPO) serine peptidase